MTFLGLYATTLVIFLALDFLGLSYLVKPVFERHISALLLARIRLLPALGFYTFFVLVVVYFVSYPAFEAGHGLLWVAGNAAILGAMAYGTYEFTNLATLKGWHWSMVGVDLSWGIALTALSAAAGVAILRGLGSS